MVVKRSKLTKGVVLDRALLFAPYAFYVYEVLADGWNSAWILAFFWADEICSWLAGWGQVALYRRRGYPPMPNTRRYLALMTVFLVAHTVALAVADTAITAELAAVGIVEDVEPPILLALLALVGVSINGDVVMGVGTVFLVTGAFYAAEVLSIAWRVSKDPEREAPVTEWLAWTSQPLILNHIVIIVAGIVGLSGLTPLVWVPALILLRLANVVGWPRFKVVVEED